MTVPPVLGPALWVQCAWWSCRRLQVHDDPDLNFSSFTPCLWLSIAFLVKLRTTQDTPKIVHFKKVCMSVHSISALLLQQLPTNYQLTTIVAPNQDHPLLHDGNLRRLARRSFLAEGASQSPATVGGAKRILDFRGAGQGRRGCSERSKFCLYYLFLLDCSSFFSLHVGFLTLYACPSISFFSLYFTRYAYFFCVFTKILFFLISCETNYSTGATQAQGHRRLVFFRKALHTSAPSRSHFAPCPR